mmetsp:Transcript_13871/g.16848  ORF Transcript_13871/g.16848 Transcript_13871/m.16848 type:complete len:729 (+) Transcript_13871:221-2407(+)
MEKSTGALTPHHSHAKLKRSVKVVRPEKGDGNIEYKRQLYQPSSTRLRSLATQMSYRLDEGHGSCIYYIGVEDDGCHSLLDYTSVSESARVLECIARSLNSIVCSKVMIQNEVILIGDCDNETKEGTGGNTSDANNGETADAHIYKNNVESGIVRLEEEPLFKDVFHNNDCHVEDEKEEKTEATATTSSSPTHGSDTPKKSHLVKDSNSFTRCEIYIRRVETHMLDASPISLVELAKNGSTLSLSTYKKKIDENNEKETFEETKQVDNETKSKPETSISETLSSRNIRVAVVGNVDAGKSTLIGTLTTSCLDDGRGRSRTAIMKHRHEIESGRTSTATTHLMGFRNTGEPISGKDSIRTNKRKSEDEIARESYRIVTLMDLAGHEKYLKTTIHGVSSGMADYSMILVNSRHPPTHMTQHHLNLCCSFGIPTIVVFTKTDGCPEHALKNSKEELFKLLRAPDVGRKPFAIRKEQDITTCLGKLNTLAPVIETSCVSADGLGLLRKLLFSLPKRRRHEKKSSRAFEFLVEDIFNVPGVGAVVSGFVNAGELSVGSDCNVYVGPTNDGTFLKTVAKSAHIARIHTGHITSGQSACLAFSLKKEDRLKLRRGMVVLKESPSSTREFDAEICVLKGEGTTIRKSYQAYVHILNVRQSAFARKIEIVNTNAFGLPPSHAAHNDDDDGIVLRPGSRAKVHFEFAQRPEYIRPGMRMLFRDGRVRGVGIITGIQSD